MSISELERFCGVVLDSRRLKLTPASVVEETWIWKCFTKLSASLGDAANQPSSITAMIEYVLRELERLIGAGLSTLDANKIARGEEKECMLVINAFLGLYEIVRMRNRRAPVTRAAAASRRRSGKGSSVSSLKPVYVPKRPGAGIFFPDKVTSIKYSPNTRKLERESAQLRALGRVVRPNKRVAKATDEAPTTSAIKEVASELSHPRDKLVANRIAEQHKEHQKRISDLVETMRQQVSTADALFRSELRASPLKQRNEALSRRVTRLSQQAQAHESKRHATMKQQLVSGVRRKAVADGLRRDDQLFVAECTRLREQAKQRAEYLRDLHAESKRQRTEQFASLSQKVQHVLCEQRNGMERTRSQVNNVEMSERVLLKEQREVYASKMKDLNVKAAKMLADLL